MIKFYTYQLTKLFFLIFSLNITCVQSVGTILNKPQNDDMNLYSNFNKRLSTISSYAKENMEEASAPYLDQLYRTNNEIIKEMERKKVEQQAPKKMHNYYDFNQDFGRNNVDMDYNSVRSADDDTDVISTNLNRLIEILGKGKGKNKKVNDDDDDDDQEEVIKVSGGNENNDSGGGGGGDDDDDSEGGGDDANNDDSNNSEANNVPNSELPVAKIKPTNIVDVKFQKPILEPTIIKTDKGTPNDEDVSNWVKHNPEKFHTFVHAMYVMKNQDNRKIKHEISCLIYCDRLKGKGLVGELNGKRCICRSNKKRRQVENTDLIDNPDESSNHDFTKRKIEISPPSLSSAAASSASTASLSSSPSVKQENPLKSSGNSLNINENDIGNNNNEDKNQMDERKLNGNLIESVLKQLKEEKAFSQSFNTPVVREPKCDVCSQLLTTECNATAVLDRVLLELDVLKEERLSLNKDSTDGKPCNISGSWNSRIVGMQFNINSSCGSEHELLITIVDHYPPKRACLMDANWTLVGYALHGNGGPFYMAATRSKQEVLATFTGMCRTCSGADTVFGTWNFIKPAKDCRDLLMAVDVKRDIFHRSTLHAKVIEQQKIINEKAEAAAEADSYP